MTLVIYEFDLAPTIMTSYLCRDRNFMNVTDSQQNGLTSIPIGRPAMPAAINAFKLASRALTNNLASSPLAHMSQEFNTGHVKQIDALNQTPPYPH